MGQKRNGTDCPNKKERKKKDEKTKGKKQNDKLQKDRWNYTYSFSCNYYCVINFSWDFNFNAKSVIMESYKELQMLKHYRKEQVW